MFLSCSRYGDRRSKPFQHNFVLAAEETPGSAGQPKWKIKTECFRYQEPSMLSEERL